MAAPPRPYDWPRLSPDGSRIAVEVEAQTWVYDMTRDTLTRLAFEGTQNDAPSWTPDGSRIAMRTNRAESQPSVFWQMADGSGQAERLTTAVLVGDVPQSFSGDGQFMTFHKKDPKTLRDIWVLSVKDRRASIFLQTPATEGAPRFSTDGRWIAYVSDESGSPVPTRQFDGSGFGVRGSALEHLNPRDRPTPWNFERPNPPEPPNPPMILSPPF